MRNGPIVVGVDGSSAARVALRWALAEAELWGRSLRVVHAWHEPMVFVPETYDENMVEAGRTDDAALALVGHELDAVGGDAVDTVCIERREAHDRAAPALVDAARDAGLLVMGRHGTGGLVQEPIGPKVIQVAHHASSPVAVVPESWEGTGRGIVVGVDGSQPAATALRWAATEASRRAVQLTAVLAWGLLEQCHPEGEPAFDPDYDGDDAMRALDRIVHCALGDASGTVTLEVDNDLPARALLAAATHAELLVVGARGLGGFRELLLGSVSHRCLVHSTCPAIVVR